jgi:hypothetical protein
MTLYDWPRASAYGRVIPKNKIYEHAGANTALRELFVREVDQIVWSHKLAPETINLAATKAVAEIQVFRIVQREAALNIYALRAIDSAISFPLLFELAHGTKIKFTAAYKRPASNSRGEVDGTRWVLGDYFESAWLPEAAPRSALPVALDMGALYEQLIGRLIDEQMAQMAIAAPNGFAEAPQTPFAAAPDVHPMSLEGRIAQADAIRAVTREIERLSARLMRERQFNKRLAINSELRSAKQELARLGAASPAQAPVKE